VGGGELLFILVLALIFLGPRRLPEIGRILGKAAGEFRKATAEFRRGVEKEIDLAPVRDATLQIARARRELTDLARSPVRAITRELEAERVAVMATVTGGASAEPPAGSFAAGSLLSTDTPVAAVSPATPDSQDPSQTPSDRAAPGGKTPIS